MDDTDPCVTKGRTSVLFDPTVAARRKRMEIRRLKKLSRSLQLPVDNLNPVGANSTICIKRARIEETATGIISDNLEGNSALPFPLHTEEAHFNLLRKGRESAELSDRGLLGFKSLPPSTRSCSFVHGAQLCSPNPDVDVGAFVIEGGSVTEMSRDQKVGNSLPSSEAVHSISFHSVPLNMGESEGTQSESTDDLVPAATSLSSKLLENATIKSDPSVGKCQADMMGMANQSSSNSVPDVISFRQSIETPCWSLSDNSCPPSGKLLVCGRRREMEDAATIVPSFTQLHHSTATSCYCTRKGEDRLSCDLHFFAVYDGHGGAQASKFCMERLHHALAEELSSLSLANEVNTELSEGLSLSSTWKKAMASCFSKIDREVGGVCPNGECNDVGSGNANCCGDSIAPENVGTTAVVAVVSSCQIVVANCGDSRAVLSRSGKAIALSRDHKPERDDECNRIEAAGGRVIYWDGYRVGGLLALSRSIGDRYLKRYVVSEPDVICLERTEEDECLILASDGLWDVISNDTACEIARRCLDSSRKKRDSQAWSLGEEDPASAAVAALLVKLAYGRGSKDNISVVVVDLKS